MNQWKKWFRNLGNAVYLIIFLLAVICYLIQLVVGNETLRNMLISLSSNLVAVALVFFLVNLAFGYDRDELREWQQESFLNDLKRTLAQQTKRELIIYPTKRSVFDAAINTVTSDHWKMVRVFAPVGLWREDEAKTRWLETLAENARTGRVETVRAVFGLPPASRGGRTLSRSEVVNHLEYAKTILSKFSGLRNAILQFYPPSSASASVGVGAIIFERRDSTGTVAFGLAVHEHEEVVDRAFGVENDEIFAYARDWFDDHIFGKATRVFILQDDAIPFLGRWDDIVKTWYGEDYLPSQKQDVPSTSTAL